MKKIAGTLRLELATFRELASFAQFASDLDISTQKKIEKGKRLVEILKQVNNSPIPFYKQIVIVYAGINNYLNEIDTNLILKLEKNIYAKMKSSYKELADNINEQKELSLEIEEGIKALITEAIKEL